MWTWVKPWCWSYERRCEEVVQNPDLSGRLHLGCYHLGLIGARYMQRSLVAGLGQGVVAGGWWLGWGEVGADENCVLDSVRAGSPCIIGDDKPSRATSRKTSSGCAASPCGAEG